MKILALEPYYGGSHKAFVDGWRSRSRHDWTLLHLPPHKWKWRMRHAAVSFADELSGQRYEGRNWDILLCSDMLNLAEFLGLAPPLLRRLPTVAYFHENQLTYPVQHEDERDYHFVLTNLTTALAATRVWFNSAFHRDEFLGALPPFLKRMPDHQPFEADQRIRRKSAVQSPGVGEFAPRDRRAPGPLRVLWAARWEHDKNPQTLFDALTGLKSKGVEFRVSVVGEQFRQRPAVFDEARRALGAHIDRWGFQPSRREYESALAEADVIVSTADHEFFGISVVEAIAAGAYPLLPRRLSYPEILAGVEPTERFFYDGSVRALTDRLQALAGALACDDSWCCPPGCAAHVAERFSWPGRVAELDRALQDVGSAG